MSDESFVWMVTDAIKANASPEVVAQVMEFANQRQREAARKECYTALSKVQASMPPIPKNKIVKNKDGSERYRYATLDSILKTAGPVLEANGFSWRFETESKEESLLVTCVLAHSDGQELRSSVEIPDFAGQGTNAAQDAGGINSYGRRYSFSNVVGISVDEDNDAQTAGPDGMTRVLQMMTVLRNCIEAVAVIQAGLSGEGDIDKAAEAYAELSWPEVQALNLAPSKGGIWTTEERKKLRETDFTDRVHAIRKDSGWYELEENER